MRPAAIGGTRDPVGVGGGVACGRGTAARGRRADAGDVTCQRVGVGWRDRDARAARWATRLLAVDGPIAAAAFGGVECRGRNARDGEVPLALATRLPDINFPDGIRRRRQLLYG